MNFTVNSATTINVVSKTTGTILPAAFNTLASNPIGILAPLAGKFYNVLAFSLELGQPALLGQLYPFMLRQCPFVSGVNDSLAMLYPKNNNDNNVISVNSFSGFFGATTNYINTITNTEVNNGIYLTSVIDENWNFTKISYFSIIYTIEDYHS